MTVPQRYKGIVGAATAAAGGVGVPGAFAFGGDVPVLIGIWGASAAAIAEKAGHNTSREAMVGIATTAAAGTATFIAGSKVAGKLFHLLPGPGTLAAIGVNSSLNAFFTYRFVRSVAKVYDRFDDEEIIWQTLQNGMSLVSIWAILDDVEDMLSCVQCADQEFTDFLKGEAKLLSNR